MNRTLSPYYSFWEVISELGCIDKSRKISLPRPPNTAWASIPRRIGSSTSTAYHRFTLGDHQRSRHPDDPQYIGWLVKKVITASVDTVKIVDSPAPFLS